MRSKAEALAKPMAGDRWRKGSRCRKVLKYPSLGALMRFYEQSNDTCPVIRKVSFRRWAANAEYLGGPE